MIISLIYLAICLFNGDVSVEYPILTSTIILDIAWMLIGALKEPWKK